MAKGRRKIAGNDRTAKINEMESLCKKLSKAHATLKKSKRKKRVRLLLNRTEVAIIIYSMTDTLKRLGMSLYDEIWISEAKKRNN